MYSAYEVTYAKIFNYRLTLRILALQLYLGTDVQNPPLSHKLPHKLYTSMKLNSSQKRAKNYGRNMSQQ